MGLLDDLMAANESRKSKCLMGQTIDAMSDLDRGEFLNALESGNFSCSVVSTVLKNNGYIVSEDTVRRHVQSRCRCGV